MRWILVILAIYLGCKNLSLQNKVNLLETEKKALNRAYELKRAKVEYVYPDKLNIDNLRYMIIKAGIQHPEIVLRQAIIETGNLNCKGCSLDNNNLFGFRVKSGYKKYNNWHSSVYDYAQWQREHYGGGDYYKFLERIGYAKDPNYINKLKK